MAMEVRFCVIVPYRTMREKEHHTGIISFTTTVTGEL